MKRIPVKVSSGLASERDHGSGLAQSGNSRDVTVRFDLGIVIDSERLSSLCLCDVIFHKSQARDFYGIRTRSTKPTTDVN